MKRQRTVWVAGWAAAMLGVGGCAYNAIVAHGTTRSGVMFGPLGVTGHNNVVTVKDGSRLGKLSVIGDGNTITVEDGATIRKVEFWGRNNIVSVPPNLVVHYTNVGNGNQVIPRGEVVAPPEIRAAEDASAGATPPAGGSN